MKNRFNNLTSKEWLPFQKSWFEHRNFIETFRDIVRFFVKFDHESLLPSVLYHGPDDRFSVLQQLSDELEFELSRQPTEWSHYQLIIVDDLDVIIDSSDDILRHKKQRLPVLSESIRHLAHRRFLCYLAPAIQDSTWPLAWEMSYDIAKVLSLKDEKMACYRDQDFVAKHFYCCFFRRDEQSPFSDDLTVTSYFADYSFRSNQSDLSDSWSIVRPKRRNKKELLHPAKFPESLIQEFIERYTDAGEAVFDPMSGTGSTQYAALSIDRHGYGTELSTFFHQLAVDRLSRLVHPEQPELFEDAAALQDLRWDIRHMDAKHLTDEDWPDMDYIITSPPYWNILNMKGAEHQSARRDKGLQLNYSDEAEDLGNIESYDDFLQELMTVYSAVKSILKAGRHMTVIVKNIKKKGKNYPFAYDLAKLLLRDGWQFESEFFWLQDDIRLAPYGYGNTFVSNTFHQYCLTFKKP